MEAATTTSSSPAPGELALLQRFVNTADLEEGTDELSDPERLRAWVRAAGLPDAGFDEADRRHVIEFREALRRLLRTHNGGELDADSGRTLAAAARSAPVLVAIAPAGAARLEPAREGVHGLIGRLLAIVARADAEGSWPRLKACSSEACMWAFYDHSRNRSRTWCAMSVCGNRAKARSYRARHQR